MADFDDLQTSGLAASNFNSCLSTIFSPPKIEESMPYAVFETGPADSRVFGPGR
jgi:hypothetical protein